MAELNANLEKYRAAQERISAGKWAVDPETGRLFGRGGREIGVNPHPSGYRTATVLLGANPQAKNVLIHRIVWESVHGLIEDPEAQINHLNGVKHDNRIVNLELTDAAGNIRHANLTGLARNPRGEKHGCAKLTDSQVSRMREDYDRGESAAAIAARHDLNPTYAYAIISGRFWKHLPPAKRVEVRRCQLPDCDAEVERPMRKFCSQQHFAEGKRLYDREQRRAWRARRKAA